MILKIKASWVNARFLHSVAFKKEALRAGSSDHNWSAHTSWPGSVPSSPASASDDLVGLVTPLAMQKSGVARGR